MPTMVPAYTHVPGNHCGSTALRNLFAHSGVEMSEEMALGLGAGAGFYYIALDGSSPSRFTNGRTSRLEEEFVELTGLGLSLRRFPAPEESWEAARQAVDEGHPALLLTDLYYLDHYGSSAHFPGHAVILAGYDDELAYLSDTAFTELQTTTIEHLGEARHSDYPVYPLAGHMLTLPDGIALDALSEAAPRAIARAAERMIAPPLGDYEGLPALRRFAAEVGEWPSQIDDWQWCARFNYQVIERRGTGGGNFRLMYSRFLEEVGNPGAAVAADAAERWSALAAALLRGSEEDAPQAETWAGIAEAAASVLDAEERLWPALAA